MLVLTRKYQEKIRIGNDIVITVLRTKGKAVRLGIEAPTSVPVVRGELAFEHGPEEQAESDVEAIAMAPGEGRGKTNRSTAESSWSVASHPIAVGREHASECTEVGLRRVPRDKVAKVLPRLVSGNAPLRAMLDERSTL